MQHILAIEDPYNYLKRERITGDMHPHTITNAPTKTTTFMHEPSHGPAR